MDLQVFFRVIARFKLLVALGLVAALCLAFLSFVRVDFDGGAPSLSYRSQELWASNARLLVTQPGFAWGTDRPGPDAGEIEGRLPTLASIYSSFATSDPVRQIMRRSGPIRGTITASPVPVGPSSSGVLPVVNITALDYTVQDAILLANRAAAALQTYVRQQQQANGVPPNRRIELRPLNVAFAPELIEPRSRTMPIVVFLAVMFATLSLAFVLENLRPRIRVVPDGATTAPLGQVHRPDADASVGGDRAKHSA